MIIFCAFVQGVVWLTAAAGAVLVMYGCYELACMAFDGRKE